MAVKIKRWDGRTLYVAEHAGDVRAAVTEAVASGAVLRGADLRDADLSGAVLSGAVLRDADLRDADLRDAVLRDAVLSGADLRDADLRDADLSGADLSGAVLRDADLRDAVLSGAVGINPYRVNPLLMLRDQPGKIRAYKLVTAAGYGPFNGGLLYEVGGRVAVENADTNELVQCGAGINVATLDWCMKNWSRHRGDRILLVEFEAADIAAIPVGDGKFRLHRCDVVGEVDLAVIGLVESAPPPGREHQE